MSTKSWVSVVALLTAVAVALAARILVVRAQPVRITPQDLRRYPDTGYLYWQHAIATNAGAQRIPVVHAGNLASPSSGLARVDYADTIHPDKHLLLGSDEASPIPAESDTFQELTPAATLQTDRPHAPGVAPDARLPMENTVAPSQPSWQASRRERPPEIAFVPRDGTEHADPATVDQPPTGGESSYSDAGPVFFGPSMPLAADEDLLMGEHVENPFVRRPKNTPGIASVAADDADIPRFRVTVRAAEHVLPPKRARLAMGSDPTLWSAGDARFTDRNPP